MGRKDAQHEKARRAEERALLKQYLSNDEQSALTG